LKSKHFKISYANQHLIIENMSCFLMDNCSIVTTLIGADCHTAAAVAAHMCVDRLQQMPPPPPPLPYVSVTAKQQHQDGDEWR
jgi:hypothetical protein